MKKIIFTITNNERKAKDIFQMSLAGGVCEKLKAGQFVNIALPGKTLRRPISVHDVFEDGFSIIYKIVGEGTGQMSKMQAGERLEILTALGNGYDLTIIPENSVLVGGGVGVPPLYLLAKELKAQGKNPRVVLGFNTSDEVFCEDEFKALGVDVTVTTADGSYGIKGFVTETLGGDEYVCTCGPEGMLKAVYNKCRDGQFSFEARMACGFGACMGCSCATKFGSKRICKDGPIFKREEILW
jgi:dihydroorotate dehydrogenase electron transfer subunit